MRIIAGSAKGRKLKSIRGTTTRPTLDRIKESIFNMIAPYIQVGKGLDLFAGFGGLGLEALSRGTGFITFLEKDYRNCRIIKKNIDLCGFREYSQVVEDDVFTYLKRESLNYDLIFMDPPYYKGFVAKTLNLITNRAIINEQGLIIIEHENGLTIDEREGLHIIKQRQYGDTEISIIQSTGGKL